MSNTNEQTLIEPIQFFDKNEFVPVDQWEPQPEEEIFKTVRGAILLDVSSYFEMEQDTDLDAFIMKTKRSYGGTDMREHTTKYLNYLEKFYDKEQELVLIYRRIKYLIDIEPLYNKDAFFYDLKRYIMGGSMFWKIGFMNRDNYSLSLTYKNIKNPNLQYSD